ncbi:MAG TPA: hypothetical protein VJ377_06475 [Dehalococcoidales bacterium]|nr:hypothetical protein [Dehalococcoidales bacterium]
MKRKTAGIAGLLLVSLLLPAAPVSAGTAVWSAETIPTVENNFLGPAGVDIRDLAVAPDHTTVYAVPGDSISDNVVYKSVDAGVTWLAIDVDISADLVAIAPDDKNMVAIASRGTPAVYLTTDGGTTWSNLGTPQESGGNPAAAITDIAISELESSIRLIAAAGKEAGDIANLWYFNSGAPVPVWNQTNDMAGFSAGDEVSAVAFSPSFSSDEVLLAVTEDDGVGVKLQILDTSAGKWNASSIYTDYPLTVVSNAGITGSSSASLSLAPTYDASNDSTHRIFIGLTVEGNASAVATSGIYRFVDTTILQLSGNVKIHSLDFNGSYLVAGRYDSTVVHRSTDPLATTPTVSTTASYKTPGGANKVRVVWAGSQVMAGTAGNESAYAVSSDSGATFNDISLVDTVMTFIRDVAVAVDNSKIYLVTDDGSDLSLWRKTSTWQRVLSLTGTTNYIVRIARQDANSVYLAKKSATTIYYSSNGGTTQWLSRTCGVSVQDLAVESAGIAYALSSGGSVSRTANAGSTWGTVTPTSLSSGATIVSVSTGTLLVGSQDGRVAYSTDGNTSWNVIPVVIEDGAGKVQVAPDEQYATNKTIYAASDTAGQNIKKWKIGTSMEWTDVFTGTVSGGIYGLAAYNNTLYALAYSAASGQSTLWLHLSPTTATATSTSWSSSTTTSTTDADDATVSLNAAPRGLIASTGKLWAVKTNGINKLYSFTDVAIKITLLSPAADFVSHANSYSGLANDIAFTWQRPVPATEYQLLIAGDEGFSSILGDVTVASGEDKVVVLAGPNQSGNRQASFSPGQTYYWKVRTTLPLYSAYSETLQFSIGPLAAAVPQLLVPANGGNGLSRTPSFSWRPVASTTEYQFMLSDNATMTSPMIDVRLPAPAYAVTEALDYGGTYFWRVRATRPAMTDWSILANFTVAGEPAAPVPPLTVQTAPPPVIELPAPPPQKIITIAPAPQPPPPAVPGYLVTAIIIGVILVAAVALLIFVPRPGRLIPSPSAMVRPLRRPSRKARDLGGRLGRLGEDLATRAGKVAHLQRFLGTPPPSGTPETADEGRPLSFAAKSFLWLMTSGEKKGLSAEEEQNLGKKLASRIKAIAKEHLLYEKFPGDAPLFLQLWARYGSREETGRYIAESLRARPEYVNALLRSYLNVKVAGKAGKSGFTRARYDAMAEVADPNSVAEAIIRLYKPELGRLKEDLSGESPDRITAYQFLRLHRRA